MRESEPEMVADLFRKLGITVEIIDAREEFLTALKGITDPEEKREAITQTFYKNVFGRIVRESIRIIAYAVSIAIDTFGTAKVDEDKIVEAIRDTVKLSPKAIIDQLQLRRPIYRNTAAYGHFGREEPNFTWEQLTLTKTLKSIT